MAVGEAIDALGGELGDRPGGLVELEAVFQHHLVEDVGLIEQGVEGRPLVHNVLPEQGDKEEVLWTVMHRGPAGSLLGCRIILH